MTSEKMAKLKAAALKIIDSEEFPRIMAEKMTEAANYVAARKLEKLEEKQREI